MFTMNRGFSVFLFVVMGSLIGCSLIPNNPGSAEIPKPSDDALPDFSLVDVNANSARYQETVSPRDYLGLISAWYFGHST
jgi:hypothetical protein